MARPMLARSLPPERANREKLFRAAVKRSLAAGAGIGGRAGADAIGPGGVGPGEPSLPGTPPSGVSDAAASSQLGINGVPPPGPPYALDVPIQRAVPCLRVRSAVLAVAF